MTQRLISFFVLLGCCGSASHAQAPKQEFSVMTWNLEWFFDDNERDNFSDLAKEKSAPSRAEWDWRRDEVAKSIAESKPTILAVQEVENRRVLWYLARALDRNHKLEYHELALEGRDFFTEQDVGFLYKSPADAVMISQGAYPRSLRSSQKYFDVSKHLIATFTIKLGDEAERVTVLNLHFRSKPEAASLRVRQARLVQLWISANLLRGEHVIVLGDFNTELDSDELDATSDIGVICGLETKTTVDDLVDLSSKIRVGERQTHALGGKQFDRILCNRALLEDDPGRKDLALKSIKVMSDLALRDGPDDSGQHWEDYWSIPQSERDLSDHYPVMATFELR